MSARYRASALCAHEGWSGRAVSKVSSLLREREGREFGLSQPAAGALFSPARRPRDAACAAIGFSNGPLTAMHELLRVADQQVVRGAIFIRLLLLFRQRKYPYFKIFRF